MRLLDASRCGECLGEAPSANGGRARCAATLAWRADGPLTAEDLIGWIGTEFAELSRTFLESNQERRSLARHGLLRSKFQDVPCHPGYARN